MTREERLLWEKVALRHIVIGPDGLVYLLTFGEQGQILRLDPA